MSLERYLAPERVVSTNGTNKQAVLEEMVDLLAGGAKGVGRDEISRAIWRREGLMSTGIGHGLAVPHVRLPGLAEPVVAAGICQEGVADYESLDGAAVQIVVMIAAPEGEHETYIRLLAEAVESLKSPEVRRKVVEANDPGLFYDVMTGRRSRQEAGA